MRLLLTPRWLGALALAAVFAVVCVGLGRWQYGRYEGRSAAADLVDRHYAAAPVALDTVLPAGRELPEDAVWTRVTARGTYLPAQTLWVRNRPQNVVYGFEVLVPLKLDDGTSLLVDRGWAPNAERAELLPQVPPAPTGTVHVTGWLRRGEPNLNRDIPPPQIASIALDEAAADTRLTLRQGYLILDTLDTLDAEKTASGATPDRPKPLLPPDTSTGPHFAYALQWWAASLVGFVVVFVFARRDVRDAQILAVQRPAAPSGSPREPPVAPVKAGARRQRVWDWDAEDE